MEAAAAEDQLLDDGDVETELLGADGGDVAAGAAAEEDEIERVRRGSDICHRGRDSFCGVAGPPALTGYGQRESIRPERGERVRGLDGKGVWGAGRTGRRLTKLEMVEELGEAFEDEEAVAGVVDVGEIPDSRSSRGE